MSRTLRAPVLLVLALLGAALAVVTQPAPPARAGESGKPLEGNYVALDQPKRLFDGSLTAQQVTYFDGMGNATSIPATGVTGLQLLVTLKTYTTVTSIRVVGKNMDRVPPELPYTGPVVTANSNKGPIMNSQATAVDDSLPKGQLAVWNIQGAAGTTVGVAVDVVGYYTKTNVGGGYVPVNQSVLFDTAANGGAKLAAGATLTKKVTGGAVPTGATAVFMDLDEYGIGATAQGSVVAVPNGTAITSSTWPVLRVWTGGTGDSDLVVVKLNSDGQVVFKNTGTTAAHLRATVEGYATNSPDTGDDWQPTVTSVGIPNVPAHGTVDIQATPYPLPASGVAAVSLHVNVKDVAGDQQVLMYPTGTALNPNAVVDPQYNGDTSAVDRRSGVVVVPGVGGKVTIENQGGTAVSVDVQVRGWYAGPTTYATAGGNSAMTFARTAAGPCFAYLDSQIYSVWAGCAPDFGQDVLWANLSPAGEQFSGQVQIVSRPNGRAVVVARHAGDGEIWTWEFAAGVAPNVKAVRTFRQMATPVAASNMPDGSPVAFTSDAQGTQWVLNLNVTSPTAPTWKAFTNTGPSPVPTGEVTTEVLPSVGIRLIGTTPGGNVAFTNYGGTSLNWIDLGATNAVGRVATETTDNNVFYAATRHNDGSVWAAGSAGWTKINTTYGGTQLVTVGSPSIAYNPETQLHGVLFRNSVGVPGDNLYVVWESAPESRDFSGTVYNVSLDSNRIITDASTIDFPAYVPEDPTSPRWGFFYLDKTNTPRAKFNPYLLTP